jgi:hypothetical protein
MRRHPKPTPRHCAKCGRELLSRSIEPGENCALCVLDILEDTKLRKIPKVGQRPGAGPDPVMGLTPDLGPLK